MQPVDLIKSLAEVAVLLVSAWGAYNAQKMRGDLLALKDQLKDWTYDHFISRDEMKAYEIRVDRLEERPSNRVARNVN